MKSLISKDEISQDKFIKQKFENLLDSQKPIHQLQEIQKESIEIYGNNEKLLE